MIWIVPAWFGAVTGGGRCPLRKHPTERQAAITQAGTATVRGSCACAVALASRFACARPVAWGTCARVCTWEKEKERERQREGAFNAVMNSCVQILVKCEICFLCFLLVCFFQLHQHQHKQSRSCLLPSCLCFFSASASIMQVLWRIC